MGLLFSMRALIVHSQNSVLTIIWKTVTTKKDISPSENYNPSFLRRDYGLYLLYCSFQFHHVMEIMLRNDMCSIPQPKYALIRIHNQFESVIGFLHFYGI